MDVVSAEPPTDPALLDAVRDAYGTSRTAPAPPPPTGADGRDPEAASVEPTPSRRRAVARGAVGRAARSAFHRVAPTLEARVTEAVLDRISPTLDQLRTDISVLDAELKAIVGITRIASRAAELGGLLQEGRPLVDRIEAAFVNLELLKGELRSYQDLLDDLGAAIAPGAGIGGVPVRFAELRERVDAIDRRVRLLASNRSSPSDVPAPHATDVVPAGGSGFDYVGFELRFRGDPTTVLMTVRDRYFDLLAANEPVLDIGCGNGALVGLLADAGVSARGVDLDQGMVDEARSNGIDVAHGDAIAHLRSLPPGSLGSISALQVVEHLTIDQLTELLELAQDRLRPGGLLIAETPNPTSLIVLGNSYILDPTHVWPLHPSLLTFLCERAGFRHVELRFESPATGYHLPLLPTEGDDPPWVPTINTALSQLNHVLFGPQDYAVIATSPGP